ncbi:MAG TPA: class I SAM-dependent methyltransferase [Actinomycetales bacterium]|nr:class I SAM-dependent methyltransferase [Actinomycetales bacterium]
MSPAPHAAPDDATDAAHSDTPQPRWVTAHGPEHSHWYVDRFRRLAAEGADLAGEARLVDALVPVRSRLLDAGCGPGRVGAELQARGHTVVGVDVDPVLIEAAAVDHPGPTWLVGDLTTLDLPDEEPFDGAVLAGNVMPYLAPGTGARVLSAVARHLRPDAPIAVGFGLDRGYSLDAFDTDAALAGLTIENRFATWDLRAWTPHATFAVTVLRTTA